MVELSIEVHGATIDIEGNNGIRKVLRKVIASYLFSSGSL